MKKNPFVEDLQKNVIEQLKTVSLSGINQNQTLALRTQIKVLHEYVRMERILNQNYYKKYDALLSELKGFETNEHLFDTLAKNYYTTITKYFDKLLEWFTLEISNYNGELQTVGGTDGLK